MSEYESGLYCLVIRITNQFFDGLFIKGVCFIHSSICSVSAKEKAVGAAGCPILGLISGAEKY